MKNKRLEIDVWIASFATYLKRKKGAKLTRISGFWRGFEGWLKMEMASQLCEERGYEPWVDVNGKWVLGHVGVEHRARLTGRFGDEKLIDVWGSLHKESDKSHFIELKAVFNNANRIKVAASWRSDFDTLLLVSPDEKPAGVASLMFGVGFTAAEFRELADRFSDGLPPKQVKEDQVIVKNPLLLMRVLSSG